MTKFNTLAIATLSGILSIGSALADINHAVPASNQFGSGTVAVQTAIGSSGATTAGIRQVGQPANWAPIVADQAGGR